MTRSGPPATAPADGNYRYSSVGPVVFERQSKCAAITKNLRHSCLVRTVLLFMAALTGYFMVSGMRDLNQSFPSGIESANVITNLGGQDDDEDLRRLNDYCPVSILHGSEGILSPPELELDMELKYILINIRHGDRSAIHTMPGSSPLNREIPDKGPYLEPKALNFLVQMKSIRLERIPAKSGLTRSSTTIATATTTSGDNSKQSRAAADEAAPDSLNHSSMFGVSDYHLKQGQLTTRGFMQHITLGGILRHSYSAFLSSQIKSSANLYIRSTKYDRTFQSAAALLTALVPDLLTPDKMVKSTRILNLQSIFGSIDKSKNSSVIH